MDKINFEQYHLTLVVLGNDEEINIFPQCLSGYIKNILKLLWFNSYYDEVYENYGEEIKNRIMRRYNVVKTMCNARMIDDRLMYNMKFRTCMPIVRIYYPTALGSDKFQYMTNYTKFIVINNKISINPTQNLYTTLTNFDIYLNSEKIKKQIFGKDCNCDMYHYLPIINDGYCVMNFIPDCFSIYKKNTPIQLKTENINDVILAIKTVKIKIHFAIDNIIIQKLENNTYEYYARLTILDIFYK